MALECLVLPEEREGWGLCLKRVENWNKGNIMKHIWNMLAQAGSI